MKTIEAMIDTNSVVKFKEVVRVKKSQKVLVTFLEENATEQSVTLISEAALAKDWLKPEEDKAWTHLQKAQ